MDNCNRREEDRFPVKIRFVSLSRYQKICFCIYIVLIVCIFMQLFCNPYYGIADNGDFRRLSLKVGIDRPLGYWYPEKYDLHFWNYFLNDYIYVQPHALYYTSSSEYLVELSKVINNLTVIRPGIYDIRSFGFVLFLIYSVALFILYYLYSKIKFHRWLYILPLLSFVFFADASILMYFNSFFSEATHLVFLFLFFVLAWLWIRQKEVRGLKNKIAILIMELIACFFACAAKLQYIVLVIVCLLVFLWQLLELYKQYKVYSKSQLVKVSYYCFSIICLAIIIIPNYMVAQKNMTGGTAGYISIVNVIQGEILDYAENPEDLMRASGFEENIIPVIMKSVGIPAGLAVTTDGNTEHMERVRGTLYNSKTVLKMLAMEPHIIWDMFYNKSKGLFIDSEYGTKMIEYGDDKRSQEIGLKLFKTVKDKLTSMTTMIQFFVFLFVIVGSSIFYIYKILDEKHLLDFTHWHLSLTLNIYCLSEYVVCLLSEAAMVGEGKYLFIVNQLFYISFFIFLIHAFTYFHGFFNKK